MNTNRSAAFFYQFLGAHSLLIGLLPFFLPVYLWTHGLPLAGLSLLIGVSGISFALSLSAWQRCSSRWPLRRLVALTFVLEVLLLLAVGIFTTIPGMALHSLSQAPHPDNALILTALCIGFFNGTYNAFFWTTQRTLFLQQLGLNDTGRQYGNFQIFVTLFLKVGILLGGFLLENGGFVALLAISAGVSAVSNLWLANSPGASTTLLSEHQSVGSRLSFRYSDNRGSRPVFYLDGIFLYLESHFWTLSLFLLVRQDFTKLGIAVVLLAAGFGVMFFIIKNRIDTLAVDRVFTGAVLLYALSWLLRFTLNEETQGNTLLLTLLVIAFFSSFFRLAFNKRFFDVARDEGAVRYLLIKSYTSQWILGWIYCLVGSGLLMYDTDVHKILPFIYLVAAALSLVYLRYQDNRSAHRR